MKFVTLAIVLLSATLVGCTDSSIRDSSSPNFNKAALVDGIGGAKVIAIDGVPFTEKEGILAPTAYLTPGKHIITARLKYETTAALGTYSSISSPDIKTVCFIAEPQKQYYLRATVIDYGTRQWDVVVKFTGAGPAKQCE